jgi:hypothetical protein
MDKLHILPTTKTPEILLDPSGFIKIKGRAIDESRSGVPEQMVSWIDEYVKKPSESTEVTIALEFLNSFNTLIVTNVLKKIGQLLENRRKLHVKWYYEEDDVDIYDRGAYISSVLNIPIEFIISENVSDI